MYHATDLILYRNPIWRLHEKNSRIKYSYTTKCPRYVINKKAWKKSIFCIHFAHGFKWKILQEYHQSIYSFAIAKQYIFTWEKNGLCSSAQLLYCCIPFLWPLELQKC